MSSDSTEDRILKKMGSCPWSSLLPCTSRLRQENLSRAPETWLPEGATFLYKGSEIQQILEKCGGDLNSSSENNVHFQGTCYFEAFVCYTVIQKEEFHRGYTFLHYIQPIFYCQCVLYMRTPALMMMIILCFMYMSAQYSATKR